MDIATNKCKFTHPRKEMYKQYAGYSPCNGVPCIGKNSWQEIITDLGVVDGKALQLSHVDVEFEATNSGMKNNPYNPPRWLVRYQIMEVFVRLALIKYKKALGS